MDSVSDIPIVGGLFGGGDDENNSPGVDPALSKKQEELERQQEEEKKQRKAQLERERINMLRGRFGGSGGMGTPDNSAEAANLFSRITGRNQ